MVKLDDFPTQDDFFMPPVGTSRSVFNLEVIMELSLKDTAVENDFIGKTPCFRLWTENYGQLICDNNLSFTQQQTNIAIKFRRKNI